MTAINAYNQNISITSYAISGLIIGGFARISMGSKGVAVGSTLGMFTLIFFIINV